MIYLDNAATTYPKPKSVYAAAIDALTRYGANPGRSAHDIARAASSAVYAVREKVAEFFGCPSPENVVFTLNTTHALNLAICGVVKPEGRVVTTLAEHNAVLRPLYKLQAEIGCKIDFVKPDFLNHAATLREFSRLVKPDACAVVVSACSNVNGYKFPLEAIGKICRRNGVPFIVDGAQGAGYFDIDMQKCSIDMLCVPGHKGLYGICGAGALIVGKGFEEKISPLMTGGSGVMSKSKTMPPFLPEKLEVGTIATVPVITMGAGIDYINAVGIEELNYRTMQCSRVATQALGNMKGVNIYSGFGSIVLFNVQNVQCDRVSELLNEEKIAVRSGIHCAPLTHELLKTGEDGAVRASFGAFNTPSDAERLIKCIEKIKKF